MSFIKKYRKITLGIFLLLLIVGSGFYYFNGYREDVNKQLPITKTIDLEDRDLEGIGYSFWLDLMGSYTGNDVNSWKRLSDARYDKVQLLAGDENEFAVGITFWVKLEKKNWSLHNNWGTVQKDGTIKDIQWTLRIKKTAEHEYTLEKIEETAQAIAGLSPVKDTFQKEAGITLPNENYRYQIENERLKVTYDDGENWQSVPASLGELFAGDYSGDRQELIEGSYVITPEKTAFVIGEEIPGDAEFQGTKYKVLQSTDEGETWKKSDVTTSPQVRARFLDFTSEQNGSLIISYDRTMGFEANAIYKTENGGESWSLAGSVEQTNQHVSGGDFMNDQIGYISFGSVRENDEPERPSLYRTADGGETWEELDIPIPLEYKGVFTEAEVPTFDGTQGILLVNQGPDGDYQGGKVMARFTSVDEGATWFFSNLADPDNVIDQ